VVVEVQLLKQVHQHIMEVLEDLVVVVQLMVQR
jgi:hypothetical protein